MLNCCPGSPVSGTGIRKLAETSKLSNLPTLSGALVTGTTTRGSGCVVDGGAGRLLQKRGGVVADVPGVFFIGQEFLFAAASATFRVSDGTRATLPVGWQHRGPADW